MTTPTHYPLCDLLEAHVANSGHTHGDCGWLNTAKALEADIAKALADTECDDGSITGGSIKAREFIDPDDIAALAETVVRWLEAQAKDTNS